MKFQRQKGGDFRLSLTLLTALMVCIIALLAGASLWLLRSLHGQLAHARATRAVLNQGKMITARLAEQPFVKSTTDDDPGGKQFERLVDALHAVEEDLQYVSVTRGQKTVFHRQLTTLDASETSIPPPVQPTLQLDDIHLSRRILKVRDENIPVVVFTVQYKGADNIQRTVEVALRKEAVSREEDIAATSITSMFKVSLATTLISFAACTLMVVRMMRKEIKREKQRREQEHMVFAGVLANGIAHDFRNPMSSLRLDIQMLEREAARTENRNPERLTQLAQRAVNTMNRMDKVFQEFMALSKPVSETLDRIRITNCIRECTEMLTGAFEAAGVAIEPLYQDDSLAVMADQTSLRRALVNVLTNALQFSKKGDKVRITLTRAGGDAILDITDQGPGIPSSERKRIFEMFVSTRPGGIGLGLFLARTAVERAGGTIKVVDIQGGGACFRITLPLADMGV